MNKVKSVEEFEAIIEADIDELCEDSKCVILKGLKIIEKYLPNSGVGAVAHEQLWACCVHELISAGVTIEDANKLSSLGWFIDEDSLSRFV